MIMDDSVLVLTLDEDEDEDDRRRPDIRTPSPTMGVETGKGSAGYTTTAYPPPLSV
jgi:hypothetical protein